MLWGLASLSITPDPAWLQQHMQEVLKRQLQKQVEPQHCGNIGWALAKMGHRYVEAFGVSAGSRVWGRSCTSLFSMEGKGRPHQSPTEVWGLDY